MRRSVSKVWPALMVMLAAAACDDPTEPQPFSSGSMAFQWTPEGETTANAWSAEGSCGARGFDLGSATCAVGSDEGDFWAALAVFLNANGTYDTVTLVHPPEEGSCTASFTPGTQTTCTVEFVRNRVDFPTEPVPTYVMTSGTITVARVEREGEVRLTGTFEGTLEDTSGLELAPITIASGTFDVEFVP